MVQIERQGFGDNGYDGSILFERKIFTERIEGVCICHMVCQQLDGVAVPCRIQRPGERLVLFAVHLGCILQAGDGDGGACLHGGVPHLVNEQRVGATGRFLIDLDGDGISAVAVFLLADGKVAIDRAALNIGVQRVRAGIIGSEHGGLARGKALARFGQRQARRCGCGAAHLLVGQLLCDFAAYFIGIGVKASFRSGIAVHCGGAVERFGGRLCRAIQLDRLHCAGDQHIRAIEVQRALHADLRAADRSRAGNHAQPAGNGRFRFGGRGHGKRAARCIDGYSTIDRAAVQRQTVRGINIAGDAVPVHVDGRRGVDGEAFRDAVEQRDLFLHIVQDILHRFILRPAALRDVVRPAASFAVLRDVGEDCRGQRRQTERQRHQQAQYSFFHKILL